MEIKREYIGTLVKISIFLVAVLSVILIAKPRYQALVVAVDPRIKIIPMNSTCDDIQRASMIFEKSELQTLAERDCTSKCNSIKKGYYYWQCNENNNIALCYCR